MKVINFIDIIFFYANYLIEKNRKKKQKLILDLVQINIQEIY